MKEKTDVLFLCQNFYPEYVSSATLPFDTARALAEGGHSVAALCGYPREFNNTGKVPLKEVKDGIHIKRTRYLQLDRASPLGRIVNYFSITAAVFTRFYYLRNFKVIIVYTNPPLLPLAAAWASKFYKSRMILVSYDVYPEIALVMDSITRDGLINRTMDYINRRVYRHVHKVVALSSDMKDFLLKNRALLKEDQVAVIPNWYEGPAEGSESPEDLPEKRSEGAGDELVVSFFGNMGTCQDVDTVLAAIRQLKGEKGIRFVFAGHGNKKTYLAETIRQEGLEQAVVHDFLHGQEYEEALYRTDVFLLSLAPGVTGLAVPSRAYGFFMAGRPVIAIMGGEAEIARDLTENRAGYVIANGDAERLVAVLLELKADERLRREMGRSCRRIYEAKYTFETARLKYLQLIEDTLKD